MALKALIVKGASLKEYLTPEHCFIYENTGANTTGDPNVSIARARVKTHIITKLHHLDDIQEIYVITSGKGKMHIEGLDSTEVGEGDVVVIPPGIRQCIENVGDTDLIFYCVCTPSFKESSYHSDE